MTIALTGATGFVGQTVLDVAASQGREVRALTRSAQDPRKGVEWIRGDLFDRQALAELMHEAEAVIHVAGVLNAAHPGDFETGNVSGTLSVVEEALAAGVPRFVHVSSLSARQPSLSFYGHSKNRAERIVKASGLDWSIVRPPAVYGPRDHDMFELFRAARWGMVPVPKEGRTSVIHVEDLARLLLALIPGGEDVTHLSFEPDDGRENGWSHYELARAIGWAMGRRPKVFGLSKRMLENAARADMALRGGKARLTLDRVGYMNHPDWVAGHGAQPPFDLWRPAIETRRGLKDTARWYREQGWF